MSKRIFAFFCIFLFIGGSFALAEDNRLAAVSSPAAAENMPVRAEKSEQPLITCQAEQFGVQFLCNPRWPVETVDDLTVVIIASDPVVAITLTKLSPEIRILEQVSSEFLKEEEIYEDNFVRDRVQFANRDAIQVKAFSRRVAGARVLDYFYIHESALTGAFFSVYPKEKWDDYKFLVKRVADSFTSL